MRTPCDTEVVAAGADTVVLFDVEVDEVTPSVPVDCETVFNPVVDEVTWPFAAFVTRNHELATGSPSPDASAKAVALNPIRLFTEAVIF